MRSGHFHHLMHSLGLTPWPWCFSRNNTNITRSEKQCFVNSRFSSSWCTKDAALDRTSRGVSILGQTLSVENQIIRHMDWRFIPEAWSCGSTGAIINGFMYFQKKPCKHVRSEELPTAETQHSFHWSTDDFNPLVVFGSNWPGKILFFPKILLNVIALDSNLLTLFTKGISTSHNVLWVLFHLVTLSNNCL